MIEKLKNYEKRSKYQFLSDLQGKITEMKSESEGLKKVHLREVELVKQNETMKAEMEKMREE